MISDPEEWIKAEEAALKALEAEVADRRRSVSLVLSMSLDESLTWISKKRTTAQDTGTPPARTLRKPATPGSASPLLPQLRKGMTPSAHSPLLTTSMHGGLDADHLSTPTPASGAVQHPASVFKRASARQPLTVSRTMEATRGQIKTISSAAKHSLLTSHRSPVSRLAASPDIKSSQLSSPPVRSKPALASGRLPPIAKTQSPKGVEPNRATTANAVVSSPAPSSTQNVTTERNDFDKEVKTTPAHEDKTPTKAATPARPPATATVTPRSKTRKAVEGVEIRFETRQAIVSRRAESCNFSYEAD